MAKTIQVNLQFNADTTAAKAQIQNLQNSLNSAINSASGRQLNITPEIQKATQGAMELKTILQQATNQDTGKINLTKFQAELNRSGKTLQEYSQQLQQLGPKGQQAFSELAGQIVKADNKVISLSAGMKKLANTFMNTVRWQVTSSAIMAVTSSISETIQYAEKLDTSLNGIRVVTGKSSAEMAKFAVEAQKAAKALSTSTTKFTDASLIYFQQGLNDREVRERTETTIKLANVVGESASTVSEWMTAIWNNFDDGSMSLEYYADVLTKLGAATASSADEIAGGLEKFASIADTVGLSYEYAASMLATITAETRQSEDVVGTSLKTILSRMESLELGDTLDDGTTLGQYALALQKVGVNIKDTSGELKDMDEILSQTGERWKSLSRDEQVALAQSVAGIRQYSQFIALMDNWGTMKENLAIAEDAAGSLADQQAIYEESVRASQERMTASLEGLKAALIGSDDVTAVYDVLAGGVEVVNTLVESFGGLRTILLAVVAAFSKIYQPQIASFLSQTGVVLKSTGAAVARFFGKKDAFSQAQITKQEAIVAMSSPRIGGGEVATEKVFAKTNLEIAEKMAQKENELSEVQKQKLQWLQEELQIRQQIALQTEKKATKTEVEADSMGIDLSEKYGSSENIESYIYQAKRKGRIAQNQDYVLDAVNYAKDNYNNLSPDTKQQQADLIKSRTHELNLELGDGNPDFIGITDQEVDQAINSFETEGSQAFENLIKKIKELVNQEFGNIEEQQNKDKETIKEENSISFDAKKENATVLRRKLKEKGQKLNPEQEQKLAELEGQEKTLKRKKDGTFDERATKKYRKELQELQTDIEQVSDKESELTRDLNNVGEVAEKSGKQQVDASHEAGEAVDGVTRQIDDVLNNPDADKGITNYMSEIGASAVTATMGVSMLYSGLQGLFSEISSGEFDLGNFLSSLTSLGMGALMVIPQISKVSKSFSGLSSKIAANIAAKKASKKVDKDLVQSGKKVVQTNNNIEQSEKKGILTTAKAAIAKAAKKFAENPISGIVTVVTVAGLLAAAGAGIVSGISAGNTQKKEEEVSEGLEKLDAIKENEKLSSSLDEVIDKYNSLKNAGQSTNDTFKEIVDSTEELIEDYKELAATLESPIDISELEQALKIFESTGDSSKLETAKENIDAQIAVSKTTTAKTTADAATSLAMDVALKGQGHKANGGYTFMMGDANINAQDAAAVQEIFNNELKDLWNGSSFTIKDRDDTAEVIEAYNRMISARDKLLQQGLQETDYYRELNEEVQQFSEHMGSAIEAQNIFYTQGKELALKDEESFNKQYNVTAIEDYNEYIKNRENLIIKLKDTGWTETQIKDYLKSSSTFGNFESTLSLFGDESLNIEGSAGNLTHLKDSLKAIKEWYANLPEDDRTLAVGIDWSLVGNLEDVKAALQKIREQAEEAAILQEAETKLSVDKSTFSVYNEGLAEINAKLDKTDNLTKQISLNNLKISKGLETLAKSWANNYNIIKKGNKATFEYAESIGSIKSALEEMFGVTPSTDFVEKYADDLNQILSGNKDKINNVQQNLAKDYVENMEIAAMYSEEEGETIGVAVDEAREALLKMLDGFDTTIDVGELITFDDTGYMDTIQKMLDAGQITQEELEKIFRAQGYEFHVDSWKEVPGPEKTITRTITDEEGNTRTETEKSLELMKIPVINGDTSKISIKSSPSADGTAKITKSTDTRVIDTSDAKKKQKNLDKELTRYHELEELLSDIERELDDISKAKERAFGQSKLSLIDQELQKQKELIEVQKQYQAEAQKYYNEDRQKLLSNYAVKLDDTGRITNYTELERQYVNAAKSGGDSDQEKLDNFKEAVKNYEDSLNKLEEKQQAVIDGQYELQDLALEKIQCTVEFKIEGLEDALKEIELLMQEVENDAFAVAASIALTGQQANNTLQQIEINNQGIKDVESALANGSISTADGIEQLREYRDNLIDLNSELLEMRETVKDKLTEAFDAWNEKLEDNVSIIEHCSSLLEGYRSIIDLIGKDMLGISDSVISELNKAKLSNAEDAITSTRAQLEANNAVLADYRAKRATARTDEERKDWDEQIKLAEEKSRELEETLQGNLTTGLQAAVDVFGDSVNLIADNFSKAVSGVADTLSELREMFDRQQEVADRYLETYEKTYEINKLNRQINKQLSSTTSTKFKNELTDLYEDLVGIAESEEKISKNQLTQRQKYYDLLVAEQALQDAQNAKSIVRLQRDSKGNFGYVYTADQNAVADAQQKYEDALYAYQDFAHNFEEEMSEMWITLNEQREEQLRAAAEQYGIGTEEFIEAEKRINAQFEEDTKYITSQYQWMCDQNQLINDRFQAGVAETYNDTMLGQIYPDYESFSSLFTATTEANEQASEALQEELASLAGTIKSQFELAGVDVDDFSSDFIKKFATIAKKSDSTADTIEDFADDMKTEMGKAADAAKTFYTDYANYMKKVRNDTEDTIKQVNELIKKYQEAAGTKAQTSSSSGNGAKGSGGSSDNKSDKTKKEKDKGKTDGDGKTLDSAAIENKKQNGTFTLTEVYSGGEPVISKTSFIYRKTYKKNNDGTFEISKKGWANGYNYKGAVITGYYRNIQKTNDPTKEAHIINLKQKDGTFVRLNFTDLNQLTNNKWGSWSDFVKEMQNNNVPAFDTGGYTGSWNTSDGKLAMLHEKELVLNKHETADFLAMTKQFRDIIANYDYQQAMKSIEFALSTGNPQFSQSTQPIMQDINISASFPNATNHSEIEEAFRNLSNLATQYVNRKS